MYSLCSPKNNAILISNSFPEDYSFFTPLKFLKEFFTNAMSTSSPAPSIIVFHSPNFTESTLLSRCPHSSNYQTFLSILMLLHTSAAFDTIEYHFCSQDSFLPCLLVKRKTISPPISSKCRHFLTGTTFS